MDDRAWSARAAAAGVTAVALRALATTRHVPGALLLGFAAFDDEAMRRGVAVLQASAGRAPSR